MCLVSCVQLSPLSIFVSIVRASIFVCTGCKLFTVQSPSLTQLMLLYTHLLPNLNYLRLEFLHPDMPVRSPHDCFFPVAGFYDLFVGLVAVNDCFFGIQWRLVLNDPSILVSFNVYLGVASILRTTTTIFPGFNITC